MGRHWQHTSVCPGVGGELKPTLAGTTLTVADGAAWVDGHFCEMLSQQTLSASANGIAVIRFDPIANSAELVYRDGVSTPTQSPTGIYEMVIGQITASVLSDRRQVGEPKDRGLIAFKEVFVNTSLPAGGEIIIPGLEVTFTPVPGRRYRFETTMIVSINTASHGANCQIRDGTANSIMMIGYAYNTDVGNVTLSARTVVTAPANWNAARQFHVRAQVLAGGAGFVNQLFPSILTVDDLGTA
jgi:hypothetical protein